LLRIGADGQIGENLPQLRHLARRRALPESVGLPWYARVPTNAFGAVLGLAGLGLLWRQSAFLTGAAGWVAAPILILAAAVFVALGGACVLKAVRFPQAVMRETAHPVRHAFFGAISMAALLLAGAAQPAWPSLAAALWLAGATFHFTVAVVCLGLWLRGAFTLDQVGPAWLIPTVGGVLATIFAPDPAASEVSRLMFALACSFGGGVFALGLFRVAFRPPLPAPAIPTVAILLAPPGLMFLAWVRLNGGEVDALASGLFHLGLTLTLVLIAWIPRFAAIPFSLAWWAYTFPVVAMATAAMEFHRLAGDEASAWIAAVYFAAANAIVLLVLFRSAGAMSRGSLFPPE
jgi:tellurite resistance protein